MSDRIDKLVSFIKASIPLAALISYGFGFVLWNRYLLKFGFFEYNVFQIRYLSAGLLLLLPVFVIGAIAYLWKENLSTFGTVVVAVLSISWFMYVFGSFNTIHQYLGGGKPIPVSIIGNPEQIVFLENFGIQSIETAEERPRVQSNPICLVYQNDDYALIINSTITRNEEVSSPSIVDLRAMSLDRKYFVGLQAVRSIYAEEQCSKARIMNSI